MFIDPQEIYISLELALKKTKADGSLEKIDATDAVALEQAPLYTLFNNIVLAFNNENVETSYGHYAYKTYMSIMLSTTPAVRENLLSSALYAQDEPGALDSINLTTKSLNPGSYARHKATLSGKTVYLQGRLLADVLQVDKPILDRVSISITLYPSDPKQCLLAPMGDSGYVVEIQRCFLTVGRIVPKTSKIPLCTYRFLRHVIKKSIFSNFVGGPYTFLPFFSRPPERTGHDQPHSADQGPGPEIRYDRFRSRTVAKLHTTLPFQLRLFRPRKYNVATRRKGTSLFERVSIYLSFFLTHSPLFFSYNMNFANHSFTQPYMGLYHELQSSPLIEGHQFPIAWFDSGYALYVWNCEKAHGLKEKQNEEMGVLELTGRFDKELDFNLIIIVMLSYANSYKINASRNVIFSEKSVFNRTTSK